MVRMWLQGQDCQLDVPEPNGELSISDGRSGGFSAMGGRMRWVLTVFVGQCAGLLLSPAVQAEAPGAQKQ